MLASVWLFVHIKRCSRGIMHYIKTIVVGLALVASTNSHAQNIPGSNWTLAVQAEGGRTVSCGAFKYTNEAEMRVVIGNQGSLALIVRDPYLE
ncbi:hypothetical protein, partial [Xanthobacter versatilis]|uniref:hypothetical protein n=1 Tax=Xanthobacter autotrophicus (strain ATCC BAA-1158 / Py2) TaxID=78245 RepID=UPI003729A2E7